MSNKFVFGVGEKFIFWQGPRIGTCDDPIDKLRVQFGRVRAIPDILVGFDGTRNGWVIYGSFYSSVKDDFECKEVAFIPESVLDDLTQEA